MCGRFTLTVDPSQLEDMFPWASITGNIVPRYNIAPSQPVAVISNKKDLKLEYYRWGLIPSWAKDADIGNRLINARVETLHEKPSFRTAIQKRRCLILADGFYEWKVSPGEKFKTPFYIHLSSGKAFAFAGLWDTWKTQDESIISSCTIITTQPNSLIAPIHNRMPVILHPEAYLPWVESEEINPKIIDQLISPYSPNDMEAYTVSRAVNDPKYDSPSLIARV